MNMKYAVITRNDATSFSIKDKIRNKLNKHGWVYDDEKPNLVICVGGDGTLLYAVHLFMEHIDDIMFLGIHSGTLGFFTDYTAEELDVCLEDLVTKQPEIYSSRLLEIKLDNDPKVKYALNEMRVENVIKSQIMDIYIDNEFFETCRGSGICLSTQAGSTAYNRSLRGSVVDSGLQVMQLAEITPIQHSKHRSLNNPYIMMETRTITMKSDTFDTAMLCYDHLYLPLRDTNKIICKMSNHYVNFARYRKYSYLKRLKNLY